MAKIKHAYMEDVDMVAVRLDSENLIVLCTEKISYEGERFPKLTTDGESVYLPGGKRLMLGEIFSCLLAGKCYG